MHSVLLYCCFVMSLFSCLLAEGLAQEFDTGDKEETDKGKDNGSSIVHVHLFQWDEGQCLFGKAGELRFLDGFHVAPWPYLDEGTDDETGHDQKGLLVELAQEPMQELGE